MYTNPKGHSTYDKTTEHMECRRKDDQGWILQSFIGGHTRQLWEIEGEWDRTVRKDEEEIRVTISKSRRDTRDIQSFHPCRVMSADTQNCFNALNKSYFCATSNLVSNNWWKKNQYLINGKQTGQEGFIKKLYQTFNLIATPIFQRLIYRMKMGYRLSHVPHSTTWNQITGSKNK